MLNSLDNLSECWRLPTSTNRQMIGFRVLFYSRSTGAGVAGPSKIDRFDFKEGRVLARKYEVLSKLGGGWEAEVYLLRELSTGIERAAKFFYPPVSYTHLTLPTRS